MNPKEKAKELFNKFYHTNSHSNSVKYRVESAIKGATIAVNFIIQCYKDDIDAGYTSESIKNNIEYWQQVKTEINNL